MIEARGLGRDYPFSRAPVRALAGVDVDVREGEHVAVMGPSGSGKSTLLHLLGLMDRPTAGTYRLLDRETTALADAERAALRNRELGIVFQSFHLLGDERALDNVALPLIYGGVARAERRRRAHETLARVGLEERAAHRPGELSGGERQRVAIARAIVKRPRVLLADEPTGNLDSATGVRILDLFDELHAEGLTMLVITHDPKVAERAQRTLVLCDGRLQDGAQGGGNGA